MNSYYMYYMSSVCYKGKFNVGPKFCRVPSLDNNRNDECKIVNNILWPRFSKHIIQLCDKTTFISLLEETD